MEYCRNLVRRLDYEGYICSLAQRTGYRGRESAWAIRALNIETAMASEQAANAQLAAMRLKWWQETVDASLKGKPPAHPVAEALSQTVPEKNTRGNLKIYFSMV